MDIWMFVRLIALYLGGLANSQKNQKGKNFPFYFKKVVIF